MDDSHKTLLSNAVIKVLRPLIRLLIRHEFTHAELTELVRRTYVEVAYDVYSIPEREMSVSRAAVLTGLSRKEVVRLLELLNDTDIPMKSSPNRAQRVVHGWLNDPEFLDNKHRPRVLTIKNPKGKSEKGSFQALVKRYSGDITYGAVLDELNLVGVTSQPDINTVVLVNRAYVPRKDELEQVRILAMCIADLFNTSLHNIEHDDEEKYFQRQVVYTGIEEALIDQFRQLSAEKAEVFLEELNLFLSKGRKKYRAKKNKTGKRVGFGIYYFEDPAEAESEKNKND
ncbi:MAG: hypothetical protein KTR32_10735 [Granulosicoccus sp.]|nr:hypothetical protein [Granulosicoccus sp.]